MSIKNCRVALDFDVVLVYTFSMNQSALHFQLVSWISQQMVLAKSSEIEPFHLCWHNGFLEVHNARHTLTRHPIFHNFSTVQVHHGCSQAELKKITSKILSFLARNPKCLKQFKL